MAVKKKKPVSRKKSLPKKLNTRRKDKKSVVVNELKKNLLGILVLVAICLSVAMVADIFLRPGRLDPPRPVEQISEKNSAPLPVKRPMVAKKHLPPKDSVVKKQVPVKKESLKKTGIKPIPYEVFTDIDPVIVEKPRPRIKDKTPRIAIIIDDIGYDRKLAYALFELNPDITFSVLPFSPFGRQISKNLHKKGAELMLHLPMEPVQYPEVNPGPGAILSSMSPDVLLAQLKKDLNEIPHVIGVNNHMGSKVTANSSQMNQVFTILKKNNLFFIDSRTAPKSQGKASARLLRIRFAQRDVFLDNFQDDAYISGQLKELVELAQKHGTAIGIGHPYKATLETLSRRLPGLKNKIKVVRASNLTYLPG